MDENQLRDALRRHVVDGEPALGLTLDGLVAASHRSRRRHTFAIVGAVAGVVRLVQTGHLYWYALVMILGVFGLMTWQLWPYFQTIAH
jgi:NADH-quinone oxidoreductase subunit L